MNDFIDKKSLWARIKQKFFGAFSFSTGSFTDTSEDDLACTLGTMSNTDTCKSELFLNRFSKNEMLEVIKNVGLLDHLHDKGFSHIAIDFDRDDTYIHALRMYHKTINEKNLLIDVRLSESKIEVNKKIAAAIKDREPFDMLVVEWASAQNPDEEFSGDKPRLPGQEKPGLGVLLFLMKMMYVMGKEIRKDGFMDVPDHFHLAVMYSRKFKFIDPVDEGILLAVMRDLKEYSLSDLTWGFLTGTIFDESTGEYQVYTPSGQVAWLSPRMEKYFSSPKYQEICDSIYDKKKYRFEYDRMLEERKKLLEKENITFI
ncbi:MAG: hypothetical protein GY754_02165 [bacterium]|nr:hypothetical protein [bacterium]